MNDNIPYEKYIENRGKGRKAPSWGKHLTEMVSVLVIPYMKEKMKLLVTKGIFPDRSEFVRYLIIKFFEENKEWLKGETNG